MRKLTAIFLFFLLFSLISCQSPDPTLPTLPDRGRFAGTFGAHEFTLEKSGGDLSLTFTGGPLAGFSLDNATLSLGAYALPFSDTALMKDLCALFDPGDPLEIVRRGDEITALYDHGVRLKAAGERITEITGYALALTFSG